MKAIVTTHAQMFRAPDGTVWTNSVYDYKFFLRYLDVFDELRIITRMKEIDSSEIENKVRVDGENIEFFSLPFYRGPWQYLRNYFNIKFKLKQSILGCNCAILRIPDQIPFQLFKELKKANIPCGIEVVAHSWDLYAPGTIKTVFRPFLRIYWDRQQKYACKNADGVSYVTERYIQKRYPSNINGTSKYRFETNYTSADLNEEFLFRSREAEEFNKEFITLVHVSGINNTAKGHYELLNALSLLKNKNIKFKMIFVGGGTMLNYYKELSIKLLLEKEVKFVGNISNPHEIASILRKSDIFVFPSLTEGLPRVLLEAMATGLPCIATKVGGIPELLSERCLVEPKDIKGLTGKILEFLNNEELLKEESFKNYNKIINEYTAGKVQENRKNFYQKLRDNAI